jgi:hypothetical protein
MIKKKSPSRPKKPKKIKRWFDYGHLLDAAKIHGDDLAAREQFFEKAWANPKKYGPMIRKLALDLAYWYGEGSKKNEITGALACEKHVAFYTALAAFDDEQIISWAQLLLVGMWH